MNIHPAANIFPPMTDEEFRDLVEDIRTHGLLEPVWVDRDGLLIDGRHRVRACEELGIDCASRIYDGDDPIAFVVSLNLHRRHLTKGQLALSAARARGYYDEQAKERRAITLKQNKSTDVETLPQRDEGKARDQVGKAFGVSGKYVDYATKVLKNAVPEVVAAVDKGSMSINTAVVLSTEPEDIQREEANHPRRNRTYQSMTKSPISDDDDGELKEEVPEAIKTKGVGIIRANEAINCLQRIPAKDALRVSGFRLVANWIKSNK